ncbi:MAG: HAD-IA family hydrolase [Planctomycetota bacterium]
MVETSEIQRHAFNQCFAESGLDWRWSREDYQSMLSTSGGQKRIASEAHRRGMQIDAASLHRRKTQIFQRMMREGSALPRPGVKESIAIARELNLAIGLVTSTSPENVNAILSAVSSRIDPSVFDVVIDIDRCGSSKPEPDCYQVALKTLGIDADECLAVEDNCDGVTAAHRAGIACLAFPGANTLDHDYHLAVERTDDLASSVNAQLRGAAAIA